MADQNTIASGKSKEEIAYQITQDLLFSCTDGPKHTTRENLLNHYKAARAVVYGNGDYHLPK